MYFRFCGRRHVYMLRRGRREKLSILVEAICQGSASPQGEVWCVLCYSNLSSLCLRQRTQEAARLQPTTSILLYKIYRTVGAARIVCVT